ncbi:13672_t:CDS:2, partial [Dentiscutata erythropus]
NDFEDSDSKYIFMINQLLIFGGIKGPSAYELFYLDLFKSFDNTNLSWNLNPEGNLPISTSFSTASIRLFDTKKYEWSQMNAADETVDSKWFFTSALSCTFEGEFSIVNSVSPNLAVLDTNKSPFEWSIPESSKINSPPSI